MGYHRQYYGEEEVYMLTESQIKMLLDEAIKDSMINIINFLASAEPNRTLTARRLIMPAILEMEKRHARIH